MLPVTKAGAGHQALGARPPNRAPPRVDGRAYCPVIWVTMRVFLVSKASASVVTMVA